MASSAGDGFVVAEDEIVAQTRTGRQVLNVRDGVTARVSAPVGAEDDAVAVVGENRKLLVFPLDEVPEMARGKGVRLQKYKDGGLSDARTFRLSEGLTWLDPAGRTRTEADLAEWTAKRANRRTHGAARLPSGQSLHLRPRGVTGSDPFDVQPHAALGTGRQDHHRFRRASRNRREAVPRQKRRENDRGLLQGKAHPDADPGTVAEGQVLPAIRPRALQPAPGPERIRCVPEPTVPVQRPDRDHHRVAGADDGRAQPVRGLRRPRQEGAGRIEPQRLFDNRPRQGQPADIPRAGGPVAKRVRGLPAQRVLHVGVVAQR